MTRDERKIEDWVMQKAWDLYGVPSIKLNVSGNTGWQDVLFVLFSGKTLWVEFKQPGAGLDPKQKLQRKVLKYRGHNVQTHTDRLRALEAVECALEASRLHEEGGQVPARTRRRGPPS